MHSRRWPAVPACIDYLRTSLKEQCLQPVHHQRLINPPAVQWYLLVMAEVWSLRPESKWDQAGVRRETLGRLEEQGSHKSVVERSEVNRWLEI